jgi:hypothetical protein
MENSQPKIKPFEASQRRSRSCSKDTIFDELRWRLAQCPHPGMTNYHWQDRCHLWIRAQRLNGHTLTQRLFQYAAHLSPLDLVPAHRTDRSHWRLWRSLSIMALTAHRNFTGVFSMTQASLSRPGGQVLPGAFVLRARSLERVFFFKKHRRPSWSDRSSEGTAESGIGRTSTIPLQYLTVPFLPLSQSFEASFCLVLDADPSFPFNI